MPTLHGLRNFFPAVLATALATFVAVPPTILGFEDRLGRKKRTDDALTVAAFWEDIEQYTALLIDLPARHDPRRAYATRFVIRSAPISDADTGGY